MLNDNLPPGVSQSDIDRHFDGDSEDVGPDGCDLYHERADKEICDEIIENILVDKPE
jgi:hypothetical protein